jgi:hypothetical protein
MNKDELKKLIDENPEMLVELLDDTATIERLTTGNKAMQSVIDKAVAKGIDGFKQKGMMNILEQKKSEFFEEFAKENNIELNPVIRDLSKKVKELEAYNAQIAKENKINSKKADITAKIVEKGLNPNLVNFLNLEKEDVDNDVDALSTLVNTIVEEKVKTKLKGGKNPEDSKTVNVDKNPYSKENWNLTEQAKLETENPQKAIELKNLVK